MTGSRIENSKNTHSEFGESKINESIRIEKTQGKHRDGESSHLQNTGRTYDKSNMRVEYEGFADGLLYFLTAYDLSNKQNIIELPSILDKWGE